MIGWASYTKYKVFFSEGWISEQNQDSVNREGVEWGACRVGNQQCLLQHEMQNMVSLKYMLAIVVLTLSNLFKLHNSLSINFLICNMVIGLSDLLDGYKIK